MRRSILGLAALVIVVGLCLGAKPDNSIKLNASFTGDVSIEGNLATDPAVDIVAIGPGEIVKLGAIETSELRWSVRREVVLGLLAGTLKEAPLNSGTFVAQTPDGSTVFGVFTGVVQRDGRWRFAIVGDFTITGGTGDFVGSGGDGSFRGALDLRTAQYVGKLKGVLLPPVE